jgi:hypothetical protein
VLARRFVRAFWASLVVFCVLAIPARPAGAELRDRDDSSTVGVAAHHGVVTPMFRRSGTLFAHTRAPFVAPDVPTEPRARRQLALVSIESVARSVHRSFLLTRTSRGPPRR